MSDQEFEPIRLLPLLSTCAGIKNLHDAQAPLLNLCLKNSVRGYFRVPEGQVAVVYEYVKKEPNRSLYGAGKPIVVFNRGPRVDRQVKYLDLDAADLQEIRDYIAKDSTTAARRVVRELRAAMESLVEMPGKGHLRADLGEDLRALVVY